MRNKLNIQTTGPALACLLSVMIALASCGDGDQTPTSADAVEWGYTGLGAPENWAALSEEYAACADGQQQSPVDVTGYQRTDAKPLTFLYESDIASVRNNGRAVYFDYARGSALSVGGQNFELKSAHLHSPSEHLRDGVSFAAELHLVHSDAEGRLAVVGLMFRLGEPSSVVESILNASPAVGNTISDGVTLNAVGYVPDETGYYHYTGSKTTPPCDEPVAWFVMSEPRTVSQEQVNRLLALSGGPNNRPVQPLGNRVIESHFVN